MYEFVGHSGKTEMYKFYAYYQLNYLIKILQSVYKKKIIVKIETNNKLTILYIL